MLAVDSSRSKRLPVTLTATAGSPEPPYGLQRALIASSWLEGNRLWASKSLVHPVILDPWLEVQHAYVPWPRHVQWSSGDQLSIMQTNNQPAQPFCLLNIMSACFLSLVFSSTDDGFLHDST